ncbi:hypothetical protein E3N88_12617 [Mikania micrantha]|uniref:SKP1 component dimerisation domain-containing protein n=1 Tax=Mikania micrantha TaxID=192012 RepID=A0A5N6P7C3_9ASTR|nr:hypothetical protein E3N88_12617 [Mikania micrantha]
MEEEEWKSKMVIERGGRSKIEMSSTNRHRPPQIVASNPPLSLFPHISIFYIFSFQIRWHSHPSLESRGFAIIGVFVVFLTAYIVAGYCCQDANYLNIKELLDLACETIVDMNKGKTPEENPQNVEHQERFHS